MTGPFIAVDWGTTHRRLFLIDGGNVVASEHDDRGASALTRDDYEHEVAAVRARHGELPMLLAGMVGSDIGWRRVPYVEAPAAVADLARSLAWIDDRTAIVPGVSVRDDDHVDVMRGEEVQLLGAAAAGMVPPDGLLCQPGTHCKWATLSGGTIASFKTAMTGELFGLLSNKSLLARQLTSEVTSGATFLEGVAEGARRDLPVSLFSVRSRGLLGLLDDGDAASFASGILIGADVEARIDRGATVHVIAGARLGQLYSAAIEALGGTAQLVDSEAAFVAGASKIWDMAK